jgi:hypothetical protein
VFWEAPFVFFTAISSLKHMLGFSIAHSAYKLEPSAEQQVHSLSSFQTLLCSLTKSFYCKPSEYRVTLRCGGSP